MVTTFLSLIVALGLTVITTVWAQPQGFPQKPIKLIVPYPPGGATDIVSRAAATEMSKALGQPVIIENRPGAGGNLGSELVARANPDGYTMLTSPSSVHGITPFLYARLNYDPNKDLAGVIVLASLANVLVVSPGLKVQNVRELVALAKAQPGKLSCASSGSGSTIHLSCEMFKQLYGLNIIHIPYKGSAFAITDLLAGHVDLMFDNIPSAITHIRAGKLKALATTGATRSATLPDLPTMVEAGA
ncbi:MAG: tripartite tricarboxylate transporter substrate binding protein, partial [Betaproteobacteria bacterium]|nr:tripartite tricarboxylate transporter substrate binding protein [Betaproteobacteria bacterium]